MNVIGCRVVKVIMGYLSCNTMWPEDFGCSTVALVCLKVYFSCYLLNRTTSV